MEYIAKGMIVKKMNDEYLLDNKDAIVKDLKNYYEALLDLCGDDDEINTLPAKELYENACINILTCKDEIEAFYLEKEYYDNYTINHEIQAKDMLVERSFTLTREDVINNLLSTYSKYGITRGFLEENIESGLKEGLSYETIYTGLRMAMGDCYNEKEYFTLADMEEALGTTEEEIIKEIDKVRANCMDQNNKTEPEEVTRFIILPGGLK
jgi:hypothetical protein